MLETLRFDMNVPAQVALQHEDGMVVAGRYGDRVMFTLVDNRTMYVPLFVARRIKDLGIRAGESLQVCKRQVKNGQRKTIDWSVERIDSEAETQLERDLKASIEIAWNGAPTSASPQSTHPNPLGVAPLEPAGLAPRFGPTPDPLPPPNGVDHSHSRSATRPEANTGDLPVPETQLANALKTAIAAAADAEKFAKTLDYNVRFTTDDIRSMGITVLIGMQQRAPR